MKTEVYSWRVSPELKSQIQRAARLNKMPVSAVLDFAVREWLKNSASEIAGDDEQRRLHEAAGECIGVLSGSDTARSENVRRDIRDRLRNRREQ
jgi:predicted transcriptional regulator